MLYEHFLSSVPTDEREKKSSCQTLTERHLHILWLEQKRFTSLLTKDGKKIEVLSPGIWNGEAGPDFLKAHIRIDQIDYRGDIEIHLKEEGWYQHGHHQDKRYNQVILHLCYWPAYSPQSIHKENGQSPFSCHLVENLKESIENLMTLIDFDHYPSKQFTEKGKCAELLFEVLPDDEIQQLFQAAAYWRLEKKLNYLQGISDNRSTQFAAGIAMALGYKHNAKAFLELFLYLIPYCDLPYEELLAIAFGCCGFLEEKRKPQWEGSDYYQYLRMVWKGKKDQITHQAVLKLDHIRPLHHPIRRLAYLAKIMQDKCLNDLWLHTLRVWESAMEAQEPVYGKLKEKLLGILPDYKNVYWDYHYTFEPIEQNVCLPGIGKDLKIHLLLNTTRPLLYERLRGSKDLFKWEKFQKFYISLGVFQNSKNRYLHHRFFGNSKNANFFAKAQMAQGAYQLHQDFCMHYESSCKGCPFVERYLTQIKSKKNRC